MPDDQQPYIPHAPGDVFTAEDWNTLQTAIKEDIRKNIEAAKDEIRKSGVDHAGDSDKFAKMTDSDWERVLDERYAAKSHEHEGPSVYRRYIKRFRQKPGMGTVFLNHGMGRFPLVDVYILDPVTNGAEGTGDCRLLFYYTHEDVETYGLRLDYPQGSKQIGVPFEQILRELEVPYDDDAQIANLVNEMWDALQKDPNDEIPHCTTKWIDDCCAENRSVAELKRAQQWDDFFLALKPVKCGLACGDHLVQAQAQSRPQVLERYAKEDAEKNADTSREIKDRGTPQELPAPSRPFQVEIQHVDYQTLFLQAAFGGDEEEVDLMILLRG
jgi:hypothetical protein